MNRRIAAVLVACAIVVGASAASPEKGHSSTGLSCTITKTTYLGTTHSGVPRWSVGIHMANNRSAPAWVKAGIQSASGKTLYTKSRFVRASGTLDTSLTSPSATNQIVYCQG